MSTATAVAYDRSTWADGATANDPRQVVMFIMRRDIDAAASRNEGRPVYKSAPYLRIVRPGERDILERRVRESDKLLYREQWLLFQEQNAQGDVPGTPINLLFPDHPEVEEQLRYYRVLTVEQLAGITDTAIQNIGLGARDWKAKAEEYLKAAEAGQAFHAKNAENEALKATIAKLEGQVAALQRQSDQAQAPTDTIAGLQAQVAQLTAAMTEMKQAPRGPGRPRKQPEPQETE